MTQTILICPVCRRKTGKEIPLTPSGNQWTCSAHHSFDRSATGYLNLLPPSGKAAHGDNKAMIRSRCALLDSGLYESLRKTLVSLLLEKLPPNSVIWDSGCGEGYYTAEAVRCGASLGWTVYGSDLSKDALRFAYKRNSSLILTAASSYALPAASASCDGLLCLFAPQADSEFRRILKPGGYLIQAVPGERHLFGLKQAIYKTPYENSVSKQIPEGFSAAGCIELKNTVNLNDSTLIRQLFSMTPYAYRTERCGREKINTLEKLTTELHFYLFVYRKKSG